MIWNRIHHAGHGEWRAASKLNQTVAGCAVLGTGSIPHSKNPVNSSAGATRILLLRVLTAIQLGKMPWAFGPCIKNRASCRAERPGLPASFDRPAYGRRRWRTSKGFRLWPLLNSVLYAVVVRVCGHRNGYSHLIAKCIRGLSHIPVIGSAIGVGATFCDFGTEDLGFRGHPTYNFRTE